MITSLQQENDLLKAKVQEIDDLKLAFEKLKFLIGK